MTKVEKELFALEKGMSFVDINQLKEYTGRTKEDIEAAFYKKVRPTTISDKKLYYIPDIYDIVKKLKEHKEEVYKEPEEDEK